MPRRPALSPRDYQDHASCLGCGYALRGLGEWRCPECGREFNAFDPLTMDVPGVSRKPPPEPMPFAVAIIGGAIVAGLFMTIGMISATAATCATAAVVWAATFLSWRKRNTNERAAAGRGEPLEGTRHWRRVVLVLFVLSLLSGVGLHRCPHGRYYRYGPVSLFRGGGNGGDGGPCRNYVRGTRFELARNWYLIVS